MVFPAKHVIDEGHVEIEFADMLRLKPACLKFNDNVPKLFYVEKQQVDIIPSSE